MYDVTLNYEINMFDLKVEKILKKTKNKNLIRLT